jgi:hypothetical protein
VSDEDMNENMPCDGVNFRISEPAKQYLQSALALSSEQMSARGLMVCLTYSGGYAPTREGKILWNYRGPNFLIAGQKPGSLRAGGYYDLSGFRVWIGKTEQTLLEGRTLTTIQYGSPEPAELLVIENAPEDYFEAMMRGGKI